MRSISLFAGTLLLSSLSFSAAAQQGGAGAQSAEIALSNDTLEVRYFGRSGLEEVPRSRVTAGFFLSEDRDIVLDAGLLIPSGLQLGPVSFEFGPRAYAALLEEENNDVMAVSVGARLRFDINRASGLAVAGHAYYAPDILTFGAADSLTDLSARAEIRVAPQLTAFGGMRWFEFDLIEGGGERTLQEELFFGIGFRF